MSTQDKQDSSRSIGAHFSQFVRAPLERVYAAYIDPALIPKWMGIKAISNVSGPLDRAGTTFVETVFPLYRPRTEVLAAERPVLHEMGGLAGLGIGWRYTAHFAAKDDGTEVTIDVDVKFPRGFITGLVRRTQEGGRMERGTRATFATFAQLVEAGET
jgi:uncharacterized protein YndB with AHSA1/START domain